MPCCVNHPYRTNADRATRAGRISTFAAAIAWAGLLMLAARLVGDLVGLNPAEVFGPLGILMALPAGIVSMLAAQLADRYRESDEAA